MLLNAHLKDYLNFSEANYLEYGGGAHPPPPQPGLQL